MRSTINHKKLLFYKRTCQAFQSTEMSPIETKIIIRESWFVLKINSTKACSEC